MAFLNRDKLEIILFFNLNSHFILLFFILKFIDLNIYEKNDKNIEKYKIMSKKFIDYDLKMLFAHK
ncbi:MAG: hypothetical protein CMB97_01860 [Flavobacteriaceae bacterium]|nr:hypothetical protein [Flavobacteriaceae bacterium]